MSFYFARKAKAAKRPRALTGTSSGPKGTQHQAEVLNRLGCAACPLTKGGIKQAPSLAQNTQVYFLGEAEDETGEINSILRDCIPDDSYSICSFDNVINCKSSKTPSFTEIECCRPRRAKFIGTAKPRIIIGLGTVPLQAMLGSADMAGLRGRLFAVKIGEHPCWFLPTYHPDWIAKFAYDKKKPLQSRLGHCFRMDIQKAFDLVEGLEPPKILTEAEVKSNIITFDGNTGFDRLLNLLSNAKQASIKSVDIETKGLRPYSKDAAIMTCAISFGTTNFAFALNHPKSGWSKAQRAKIGSLLGCLVEDNTIKIAHNCFSGSTPIITRRGVKELKSLEGKTTEVWTESGWASAKIRGFGIQELKKITVVPYNRSTSKIKHHLETTKDHNWVIERKIWSKETGYVWKRINNFVKTNELRVGDKLVAAKPSSSPNTYSKAFIHGLIFADGAARKQHLKNGMHSHQIRLCGWKAIFADRFKKVTYPPSAKGDPICNYYLSHLNLKELPPEDSTQEYLRDFIEGWQLLDGCKGPGHAARIVSTVDEKAALWLLKHAAIGGWLTTGFVKKNTHDFNKNPILLWNVTISKDQNMGWTVRALADTGKYEKVYCATVPKNGCFTLAQGIYTGNCPFEIEWLIWLLGKEVVNHTAWECTMMQAHFLDERKGQYRDDDNRASRYQALDFLIHQHFGLRFKSLFKLNKKDMSKSDLGETLIYNAVDTKLTLQLYHRQFQQLKAEKLLDAYRDSVLRQPTVALMQSFGVPVSQKAVRKARRRLRPRYLRYKALLQRLKVVKQYIKDKGAFNWQSNIDVLSIFRDYLKCKEINVTSSSGATRISVDKNVLAQVKHPLARALLNLRAVKKSQSTYVDTMRIGAKRTDVYPDGYLHPSFNTTATETGRLSCDGPNAQNYPKRKDAWIRNQVVAPKKHLFVAIDYGQLEACTGAMCSKDKFLTKSLWEDYDVHQEWADRTVRACPELIGGLKRTKDKTVMKGFRSLIKNKLTFPAFFGATSESVRGYLANATGYEVEQSVIDDLMDDFWQCFNGMASWQKNTMKGYYNEGFVATLSGRKHRYPLTKNQAVNMPIQGTAAELVCDAMCRLSHIALSTGQTHLHPVLNIHDDLSFFIPDNDRILEDSLNVITREMLVFDFPWVNCPLSVEISIGPNWADVQSIDKVWSHKAFGYPHK